ncbi:SGNH/GDSL hydrolase family protein [Streptomyces spirodelae]|uniref:SGNH/GDSL hydrolase family protein n=1 Tax=Streptomyces spirodelae TaxID=2812904 RepID=A0ABS3WX31_9ACTN|nr:SGNH/GDSL hydrolase family protein [Streptomyces spirodelae]MBO8187690.1 SGNH/GDSL hydrolase family protein [Streptomyces spirodelae]
MRSRMPNCRARTAVALATATAAVTAGAGLGASPALAQDTTVHRYVALGDSYAAGAGVPNTVDETCSRSDRNYPSLVKAALGPAGHQDVTCGGATTEDLYTGQHPSVAPQLDALSAETDLVTLTIGGNDIGFGNIIVRCVTLGLFNPLGSPCKKSYTWTGHDELAATIENTAPKISKALEDIRARAPRAKILITGYPAILPDDGSNCPTVVSIARGDAPWLRDTHKHLNTMIAKQAAEHGAVYVDTYSKSIGHDVCKPAGTRWMEPLVTNAAAPFHPNAAGEKAMSESVLAATR